MTRNGRVSAQSWYPGTLGTHYAGAPLAAAECSGVASFPTFVDKHTLCYLMDPVLAFDDAEALRSLGDAWAWRCADTLPDSTQSRRDALADAETLRRFAVTGAIYTWADLHDASEEGIRSVVAEDEDPAWCYVFARTAARAAFRAVPGLRDAQ